MKESFKKLQPWVFADEGAYSNDKGDKGGPTRYGITYIDLARYRGIKESQAYSLVKGMDPQECIAIYKKFYWDPLCCDELPVGVDYFMFDSGLLSGIETAAKWLQRAVGAVPDGKIGPKTLAAVAAYGTPATLLGELITRRRASMKSLKQWPKWGKGWTNRIEKSKNRALKLLGV